MSSAVTKQSPHQAEGARVIYKGASHDKQFKVVWFLQTASVLASPVPAPCLVMAKVRRPTSCPARCRHQSPSSVRPAHSRTGEVQETTQMLYRRGSAPKQHRDRTAMLLASMRLQEESVRSASQRLALERHGPDTGWPRGLGTLLLPARSRLLVGCTG